MAFTEHSFQCLNSKGYHRIAFSDWGDKDAQPIICVHGLTGNGHDFDVIAHDLIDHGYRLIAVDLAGRGRSDFLPDPMDYNYNQYWQDLMGLLAYLGLTEPNSVDWFGISLGGLLGIRLAGMENSPIRRLILNDVGPTVPKAALDFIHQVISQQYVFDSVQDMEERMRQTRGLTWGPMSDEHWREMAEHNARALPDGSLTYSYDPEIARVFEGEPIGDKDLWDYWENIKCPVLTIHGAKSVVLTPDILQQMHDRYKGKSQDVIQFADCGHVPSLMHPPQIEKVRKWLLGTPI